MPTLKPFRALRYAPARVDLGAVLGDGSDDPRHVRRLLQHEDPGSAGRAALFISEWRRAGVLTLDDQPAITVVRRGGDDTGALGFFAVVPLDTFAPIDDGARSAQFDVARIAVDPVVIEVVDDSGRMRRTLEGAADREPDAAFSLGGELLEAFVTDDETSAARLAALAFSQREVVGGEQAAQAQAGWWQRRARTDEAEAPAASHALAFFVEKRDSWTRAPIGLAIAPLWGALDSARA